MELVLVAALDRNLAIGRDNDLPWHLPADLKRFKALTLGKPVLMGRKTAESLGRALPGRRNLVLTRSGRVPFEGMEAVASLDDAVQRAREDDADELCVIGGGEIYALCLPLASAHAPDPCRHGGGRRGCVLPALRCERSGELPPARRIARTPGIAFGFEFVDYARPELRR